MDIFSNPFLLRIFLNEMDKTKDHKNLHEKIIEMAREDKLAGATVFKGFLGYGASTHMHTAKILILSEDLPNVIEIIDEKEKLDSFIFRLAIFESKLFMTLQKIDQAIKI